MIYIVLIFIVLFIFIISVLAYNSLKILNLQVKNSLASVDVYLKQRFDLIPNLVEICKGYSKYENDLLNNLVKLRIQYNDNLSTHDKVVLDSKYSSIFALVENYPELKANQHFLDLQKNLSKIENQLQAARRIYNHDVTRYNTRILTIPFNIFAKIFGFKKEQLFNINTDEVNTNIVI